MMRKRQALLIGLALLFVSAGIASAITILGASGWKCSEPIDKYYQLGDQHLTRTMNVGDQDTFTIPVWGSVGYNATFATTDSAVVRIVDTRIRYRHPLKRARGMTGADEAEKTVVFEAVAPGEATVRVNKNYRGEPRGTVEIKVTVVK